MNVIDLIDDPNLLGGWFGGPSWDTWRAVLRAAYALSMSERDLELFHRVADRESPRKPVRELVALVGRRGGKDSIASAIATAAAIADYTGLVRPGEQPCVLCLACDRDQAAIVKRYIAGYFAAVPMLKAMVTRETQDGLELENGVAIVVGTNDYRAVRGRTLICCILDEAAFYGGDDAASSDREVYAAILPALATIPGSVLVIISTPHKKAGLLYDKWSKHYGRDDDNILIVKGGSSLFNSTLDAAVIEEQLALDPQRAASEWLAEWRQDLSTFLDRELVEAAVDRGVVARPPRAGVGYRAFADPSGGVGDAFTAAVGHAEQDGGAQLAVLDALYERRAPFNPSEATREVADFLKVYGLSEVTGDRYAAQWVVEAFDKCGVKYSASERDGSAIYLDVLPLFTSGRARLIDNARLVTQLCSLERRTFRSGRDRVDHGPGSYDDSANSTAGVLVLSAAPPTWEIWRFMAWAALVIGSCVGGFA